MATVVRLAKSGWHSSMSKVLGICGLWKLGFFSEGGVRGWSWMDWRCLGVWAEGEVGCVWTVVG